MSGKVRKDATACDFAMAIAGRLARQPGLHWLWISDGTPLHHQLWTDHGGDDAMPS